MLDKSVSFVLAILVSIPLVSPQLLLADDDDDVVTAEEQTDLLVEELLSTVGVVTEQVTPANADELSTAVSEFLATQDSYRLIGTEQPVGDYSDVMDRFERRALRRAYRGKMTQRVVRGELRTVIPLTFSQSDETANCAVCHSNYNALVDDPTDTVVVGAAAFRVPLEDYDGDDDDDDDDDD